MVNIKTKVMDRFQAAEIANVLLDAGLVSDTHQVARILQERFKNQISITWDTTNVQTALEYRYRVEQEFISESDARIVLEELSYEHDPDIGINWDTIAQVAEMLADDGRISIAGYVPYKDRKPESDTKLSPSDDYEDNFYERVKNFDT